jgi:molybdenum ABC transporter molybdate-binding protein
MFRRFNPAWLALGGSVFLLGILIGLLYWNSLPPAPAPGSGPLVVHCAAALRTPLEAVRRAYEEETGRRLELRFGPSEALLTSLKVTRQGDLFLPADESYVEQARAEGLVAEVLSLARMSAVVVIRPAYPGGSIATWDDLLGKGVRLAQANPDAAAIGKRTREELRKTGRWDALEKHTSVTLGTITEVANAVRLGSVDAGIVWDAVAAQYPDLTVVRLPELAPVTARVQLAVVKDSKQPTRALEFARYLAARDKGLACFRQHGFADVESGDAFGREPEIVLYAGAMLRPAIEPTITEFEKREGVRVTRVYNGCGILVGEMMTGARPDVYFACDPRFMGQVSHLFETPRVVSSNQLVIAVPKGNPRQIKALRDLGRQPGEGEKRLKVGVGHEQQCALGAITKESLLQAGVYEAVRENVAVESPTGDLLINQLRTGSLDAVVAYKSNVTPYDAEIDAVAITGPASAAPRQPVAVSRDSAHRHLAERLLEAIRSQESRRRFEELGFRWEQEKP